MTEQEKDEMIKLLISEVKASAESEGVCFGLSKDGEIRLEHLIKKYENDNTN